MREIKHGRTVLARLITETDGKNGLNFFSADADYMQVGLWKNYEKGKELDAHVHNAVEKTTNRTHEVLFIIKGSIEATIYDLDGNYSDKLIVHQGEILMLLECGHGYTIIEDGTTVLEVKNGPYLGAEIDRRRI